MVDNVRIPSDGAGKRISTNIYNDGVNDYHTQVVSIGDRDNPNVQQTIRANGAGVTEYSTGAPIFNAFNRLVVADDVLNAAYKFYEGPAAIAEKMQTTEVGTGTVAFDSSNLSYRLRVSGGAGNSACLCSHRHFSYRPGAAMTAYFVASANAPTATNVTRRMGLFNDSDGIYLEMADGEIFCCIRDSTTGTTVRISQENWNGDRLDGTGSEFNRSGAQLNPNTLNIFAITYQYLSAGAVTFSTYVNGNPVVMHTIGHYGELTAPYMATTYLPWRAEVVSSGLLQGDIDMYVYCGAVISEGYKEKISTPIGFEASKTLTTDDEVPIISFRPAQTYFGKDNRYRYLIEFIGGMAISEAAIFTLRKNATLTGDTWGDGSLSLEFDTSATSFTGGNTFGKLMVPAGTSQVLDLIDYSVNSGEQQALLRHGNIANTDTWTVTVRRVSASSNTDVYVSGTIAQVE
jgi:hypothetical protein